MEILKNCITLYALYHNILALVKISLSLSMTRDYNFLVWRQHHCNDKHLFSVRKWFRKEWINLTFLRLHIGLLFFVIFWVALSFPSIYIRNYSDPNCKLVAPLPIVLFPMKDVFYWLYIVYYTAGYEYFLEAVKMSTEKEWIVQMITVM